VKKIERSFYFVDSITRTSDREREFLGFAA